jgi:hypothetical protein
LIKNLIIPVLIFLFTATTFGQNSLTLQDSIANYFREIKQATKENQNLWNKDLYGPILLVDPGTKQIYSNETDAEGLLKPLGQIYSGALLNNLNVANTSVHWSGKDWAMVMLPLPSDKQDRINLLAHELFHMAQPSLGFFLYNNENNHLDAKLGRIYLRLELEALIKAIQSPNITDMKNHLTNAFHFRKYRYLIYPGADSSENLLELNEGIAEYTGFIISNRSKEQAVKHFEKSINDFQSNPTFVRSFPYQTIPAYGYLLYSAKKDWNKDINIKTNLADYFIEAFKLYVPDDLEKSIDAISSRYDGPEIFAEESEREEKVKQLIAEYRSKFIEQPHFEIRFENMNVSFDTRNIMPLEDKGTIYPYIKVIDNWGILTVKNGALMSSNWDKITVTPPLKIKDKTITGDGWTLELNEGYKVIKEENNGNYILKKK